MIRQTRTKPHASTSLPRSTSRGWTHISSVRVGMALVVVLVAAGCQSRSHRTPQPAAGEPPPRSRSQELSAQGTALMGEHPQRAEGALRAAIVADPFNGQAHNNLGVVLLGKGELYEAAQAFDRARTLLPTNPDPRMNLGQTYERAGRTEDALEAYATAIEIAPDNIQAIQALVRLQLRTARTTPQTLGALREVALRGSDESWRSWAQRELAKRTP
jgi:cytochrome c-type biogenesis protein CcmH/NrfG